MHDESYQAKHSKLGTEDKAMLLLDLLKTPTVLLKTLGDYVRELTFRFQPSVMQAILNLEV